MSSFGFVWEMLKISLRSLWSNVSFKVYVSLLIFYFDDLPIGITGVLISLTIIVLLSISLFTFVYLPYVLRCFYAGCIDV